MNAPDRDQIARALVRSEELPYGRERTEICERAIRHADLMGDRQLGFQARLHLIDAVTFEGYPKKALVAFAWCMARHREDPKEYFNGYLVYRDETGRTGFFSASDLLWRAKYVLDAVYRFAEISPAQILDVFEQAKEIFHSRGRSLRPWYERRSSAAGYLGLPEEKRHYRKLFLEAPRDKGADCEACERNSEVFWLVTEGRDREAYDQASPILSGELRCEVVPRNTIANLLVPLLRMGKRSDARSLHLRNWDQVRRNLNYLEAANEHIAYLALAGEDETAVEELMAHVPFAEEARETSVHVDFYSMARLVLEACTTVDVSEVFRTEMIRRADAAISAFDRRNGNDSFREKAALYMKRLELRQGSVQ